MDIAEPGGIAEVKQCRAVVVAAEFAVHAHQGHPPCRDGRVLRQPLRGDLDELRQASLLLVALQEQGPVDGCP